MLSVVGIPHKQLGAEAYYDVMIDTPTDLSSDLKQTAKKVLWSDVKTIEQKGLENPDILTTLAVLHPSLKAYCTCNRERKEELTKQQKT